MTNCFHSEKVRIHANGTVDVCLLTEKRETAGSGIYVCDDAICAGCDRFRCRNSEESVEIEFNEILRNPSRCGNEYPKLAILLWVLEGDVKRESFISRVKNWFRGFLA